LQDTILSQCIFVCVIFLSVKKKDIRNIIGLITLIFAAYQVFTTQPQLLPQSPTNQSPTPNPTAVLGEQTVGASTSAQVVRVVDGDTVRVSISGTEKTIRLIGINTPESVDPRREVQCFGKEASNKAKEILTGKTITLESDDTQGDKDNYQRLLRYVWLEDGTNFNKYMISEGYAYEYTYDLPYKYQSEFKQAQVEAQNAKRGLWSDTTCGGNV
jgi:micrococcal nuclease